MAELNANTLVRRPETGEVVLLAAGGQVPDWATDQVGEHLLTPSATTPEPQTPAASTKPAGDGPPPKGGAGSGAPEWRAYAARKGVEVPADANRDQVVAALTAADAPTE